MNKTVIFASYPDYSGNSKTLYEYMRKQNQNYQLIWVVSSEESRQTLNKFDVASVVIGTEECSELFQKPAIIFDTHGILINYKKENQIYINLWHGIGPKKLGYLVEKEELSEFDVKWYKKMAEKMDYFIVPSPLWAIVYSGAFHYNVQNFLSLGMARCDALFQMDGKKILSELTGRNLEYYKKIIVYLPTFRKNWSRNDGENLSGEQPLLFLEPYKAQDLDAFLRRNHYLLVIKYHPSEQTTFRENKSKNIIILKDEQLLEKGVSIYDFLNGSDLLITDYSSVYIEYLLLNKPVLFTHWDIKTYMDKRGIVFDNVHFWYPGPCVDSLYRLKKETKKLLKYKKYYGKERLNFLNLMFEQKQDFCKNIYDYLHNINIL